MPATFVSSSSNSLIDQRLRCPFDSFESSIVGLINFAAIVDDDDIDVDDDEAEVVVDDRPNALRKRVRRPRSKRSTTFSVE